MTPFKWCVYMNSPIDFCTPLLKEMVRRWVSRNESFVLKQTMVPFTVGDVCMGLGLGVGGLDVNFDDDFDGVVCHQFSSKSFTVKDVIHRIKHSKAVSNMPFRVLDNIDNLYEYNWAKAVHTFVLNSLGNASRKIRQGDIRDLGLSGNVAVLQICWEWFLRDEDRQNSIICAALHLEEGSIAEDDGDHLGLSWEQVLMKKIEDNQRKMVAMDKDLRSLATLVGVGKEDYEKGNDGKEEDGDVHGHGGAGQCFQTFTYSDVGGCCSGLKDDIEDVMDIGPVVSTVPLHDDTEDDNLLNVNRTQLYNMVIPFKLPWSDVGGCCSGLKDDVEDVMDIGPVVSTVPLHDDTEDDNLLNVNRTQLYNMVIPFKLPWRAWPVYDRRRYTREREGDRTGEDSGRTVEREEHDERTRRGRQRQLSERSEDERPEQVKDERPEQVEVTRSADERPERRLRTTVLSEWKQEGLNERSDTTLGTRK
ncbi:hypothetical protein LR48_Vigan08g112100 [Vigna angularis]|uniref:Aminotransferase-like plant mobile domain-containing protein n=1 Tax=Phaseolus angularis TaxID=3914 RepID=A0A0L9V6H9_PHAAN|nr:hypothetical protein LR48_Vigan08g112100 [Vigna angularis]